MNTQTQMTLTKWVFLSVTTLALLEGVTVGLVGLAFRLSFQSLLLPYAMLLACGLMLRISHLLGAPGVGSSENMCLAIRDYSFRGFPYLRVGACIQRYQPRTCAAAS